MSISGISFLNFVKTPLILRFFSEVTPSILHRYSIVSPSFRWRNDGTVMELLRRKSLVSYLFCCNQGNLEFGETQTGKESRQANLSGLFSALIMSFYINGSYKPLYWESGLQPSLLYVYLFFLKNSCINSRHSSSRTPLTTSALG